MRRGPDVISDYLKTLPSSPGVYRMIDTAGDVIYVGKARSLKARVSNYIRLGGHTNRIARMIAATASMEFVTTRTESEALLLEANLIKRFRPRFNVLLRDDKSFPYILISRDHVAPQILKHRGARKRKGDYFGPFASAGSVNQSINTLQRAFLLRSCSDSVYESRTRPCLLYQIKRCSAPCTGEISLEDYGVLVDEACRLLKGGSEDVRRQLREQMSAAADALEFERAAVLRNRLHALSHVTADQTINPEGVIEADVFGAHQDGGQTCVQVFFFRSGQNWGNRAYFPRADRSLEVGEVLDAFIAQFYDDKPVPAIDPAVARRAEPRVAGGSAVAQGRAQGRNPRAPARRQDRRRRARAQQRARGARPSSRGRRVAAPAARSARRSLGPRAGAATDRGVRQQPRVRHQRGRRHDRRRSRWASVKGQYRKFNIKSEDLTPGDDYAMMREVLTRRFKRIAATAAPTVDESPIDLDSVPETPRTSYQRRRPTRLKIPLSRIVPTSS